MKILLFSLISVSSLLSAELSSPEKICGYRGEFPLDRILESIDRAPKRSISSTIDYNDSNYRPKYKSSLTKVKEKARKELHKSHIERLMSVWGDEKLDINGDGSYDCIRKFNKYGRIKLHKCDVNHNLVYETQNGWDEFGRETLIYIDRKEDGTPNYKKECVYRDGFHSECTEYFDVNNNGKFESKQIVYRDLNKRKEVTEILHSTKDNGKYDEVASSEKTIKTVEERWRQEYGWGKNNNKKSKKNASSEETSAKVSSGKTTISSSNRDKSKYDKNSKYTETSDSYNDSKNPKTSDNYNNSKNTETSDSYLNTKIKAKNNKIKNNKLKSKNIKLNSKFNKRYYSQDKKQKTTYFDVNQFSRTVNTQKYYKELANKFASIGVEWTAAFQSDESHSGEDFSNTNSRFIASKESMDGDPYPDLDRPKPVSGSHKKSMSRKQCIKKCKKNCQQVKGKTQKAWCESECPNWCEQRDTTGEFCAPCEYGENWVEEIYKDAKNLLKYVDRERAKGSIWKEVDNTGYWDAGIGMMVHESCFGRNDINRDKLLIAVEGMIKQSLECMLDMATKTDFDWENGASAKVNLTENNLGVFAIHLPRIMAKYRPDVFGGKLELDKKAFKKHCEGAIKKYHYIKYPNKMTNYACVTDKRFMVSKLNCDKEEGFFDDNGIWARAGGALSGTDFGCGGQSCQMGPTTSMSKSAIKLNTEKEVQDLQSLIFHEFLHQCRLDHSDERNDTRDNKLVPVFEQEYEYNHLCETACFADSFCAAIDGQVTQEEYEQAKHEFTQVAKGCMASPDQRFEKDGKTLKKSYLQRLQYAYAYNYNPSTDFFARFIEKKYNIKSEGRRNGMDCRSVYSMNDSESSFIESEILEEASE